MTYQSLTTTTTTTTTNFSNFPTKCFNPIKATEYEPKYNYCIYGIKYYHNKTGFDDILYFNDPDYPWHQRDITHEEFEKAAQPLCDDLEIYVQQSAQYNTLYYAAWIMVPITTNNNVCFITASDILERNSLYERQIEQIHNRMAYEIIRLGPYSAAEMEYMNELKCRIQHSSHEDNECVVWMTFDKYGYECCCYGDLIGNCQDRISNSILVGTEQLRAYNEFIACAIPNRNSTKYTYKYDSETKKITLRGKMEDILNGTLTKSYCPLYLEISKTQYKYYMSTDEFQVNKPNNILTDGLDVGCHYYANWDIRLADIVKTRCIQLKPLMNMCLMSAPLATVNFEALCCCNHQTFCNYNGLILSKLNANNALYYCKYNTQYQYLFNDLLLIDKPPSKSCLLHYIDNSTLMHMDSRLPNNDFVLFQQPGNAFYPIDFSYAFLEDGKCHYVEVEVNFNYTDAQSCREAVMFETNYMPLKIFACRCRTNSNRPCDEELATKIQHLARSWPLTNLTQCMQYDQQRLQGVLSEAKRIFLTYTSYCYTEMTLKMDEKEVKFYVSGGEVTHTVANNVGKHLDHIAYAMWLETGSRSSLCASIQKGQVYCFCRSYSNYTDACNGYVWERIKSQKILMQQELDFKVRKEYPNRLSDHLIKKGETWCHSPNVYGTLDIDNQLKNVHEHNYDWGHPSYDCN
ncbi:unnamed protein product [Acanthocheilonema viteae]|uniref:Uncharacterized protein n=1 Tax=Acanthocheilonema viteae TaxID=6277 RepID=A0A498SE51_ACAVI|nr:unnamed protein product [Acanthocheilonema viteae]